MSLKAVPRGKWIVLTGLVLVVGSALLGAWLFPFNAAVAKNGGLGNEDVDYVCFQLQETEIIKGTVAWEYLNRHFQEGKLLTGEGVFKGPTLFCTPVNKVRLERHK